jgi:nicotinate-nucleotide adenylyltransferase
VPALAISSTDCRDRVERGMPVWYLVPDGVVQYIEKRGLYRDPVRRRPAAPHADGHPSGTQPGTHPDPAPLQPPTSHLREVPR